MEGEDVRMLQVLLNASGFTLGSSGAGSPGKETTYFGSRTRAALAEYQKANAVTPSVGYFGPRTRAAMKAAALSGLWW
jgi:peptidoglycan hydrolase-like protein with peptidoglycan-binding domain